MADPLKYTINYSFSDYQASNPTTPLPADEVDTELAEIQNSIDTIVEAIKDVRRSDGALKNLIVTYDSLSLQLRALLGGNIIGFNPTTVTVTDDFTVDADTMEAALVIVDSVSPVTISLPNDMAVMGSVVCYQAGVGPFEFVALSGASLTNKYDWYASEAQYCVLAATVVSNEDGVSAVWMISGDVSP